MTPEAKSQLQYFCDRMPTKLEIRAWRHFYLHRAKVLEAEYPKDYEGLTLALETWIERQTLRRNGPAQ